MDNKVYTIHVQKKTDKVNSVIFVPIAGLVDPIITSVYLMRPMATNKTKAKVTVEFID